MNEWMQVEDKVLAPLLFLFIHLGSTSKENIILQTGSYGGGAGGVPGYSAPPGPDNYLLIFQNIFQNIWF